MSFRYLPKKKTYFLHKYTINNCTLMSCNSISENYFLHILSILHQEKDRNKKSDDEIKREIEK